MAELRSMRNIGKEMARKLAAVGIDTPDKLRAAGSTEAFFRLKVVFPRSAWCTCTRWRGPLRTWTTTASPRTGGWS